MTSHHRTRAGLAAALAVASLAAAAPAGADPNPAQRVQSSSVARALAQEQYHMSQQAGDPRVRPRLPHDRRARRRARAGWRGHAQHGARDAGARQVDRL